MELVIDGGRDEGVRVQGIAGKIGLGLYQILLFQTIDDLTSP